MPQGEGANVWGKLAANCKVMGHSTMSFEKTAESIEMPFWMNRVLDGGANPPRGRGQFSGVVRAIQKHWQSSLQQWMQCRCSFAVKGIAQSPITSCSRRDNSVCRASENSILKISGRKVWWDCTARAKSDIYDCLVV